MGSHQLPSGFGSVAPDRLWPGTPARPGGGMVPGAGLELATSSLEGLGSRSRSVPVRTPTRECGSPSVPPVWVIPSYTSPTKTAISLPDETFDRVNNRAAALRLSRSEFFARAAEQYLAQLESSSVTAAIFDEVVGKTKDDAARAAAAAGRRRLSGSDDGW